jgi:TatD DNase family protein
MIAWIPAGSHSPRIIPLLIDIGANLTHDSFDADRAEVLARARAAGVTRLIVTGASAEGSRHARELANTHPDTLFATAGVHPHHASDYDETTDTLLRGLSRYPEVVAVGECGLDYFRNFSPVTAQRSAFERQLDIAAESGKPVFLHQRDAHDDFVSILGARLAEISGGVAHCFTGNKDQLREYLDMGLYIGITGWICDERRGHELRAAVEYLPLDRVLIETDAPYLLPRDLPGDLPWRISGRRNEPATLPHVLETLARYMQVEATELAAAATRNTETLFRLESCD